MQNRVVSPLCFAYFIYTKYTIRYLFYNVLYMKILCENLDVIL